MTENSINIENEKEFEEQLYRRLRNAPTPLWHKIFVGVMIAMLVALGGRWWNDSLTISNHTLQIQSLYNTVSKIETQFDSISTTLSDIRVIVAASDKSGDTTHIIRRIETLESRLNRLEAGR